MVIPAGPSVFLKGKNFSRVGLVRLWDLGESTRQLLADEFVATWPARHGESNSIRRKDFSLTQDSVPLVLVPFDGPDSGKLVLGYVVIYSSSSIYRNEQSREGAFKREEPHDSWETVANCSLNSVFVPRLFRGCHLGQVLVKLAVYVAFNELRFECVTAWCQADKISFYSSCGLKSEQPGSHMTPGVERERKLGDRTLWKTAISESVHGANYAQSVVMRQNGLSHLDWCMRIFRVHLSDD